MHATTVTITDCASDPFGSGATCDSGCTWSAANQRIECDMKDICPSASGGVEAAAVTSGGYYWFHGQCRGDDTTEVCCRVADATGGDPRIVEFDVRGTDQADEVRFYDGSNELSAVDTSFAIDAILLAEAGDDDVYGSNTNLSSFREHLYGGAGRDLMKGRNGVDDIVGGAVGDFIDGGLHGDDIEGNGGLDFLAGGGGADTMDSHDGADRVCDHDVTSDPTRNATGNYFDFTGCDAGGSDIDTINTGTGNDRVWASGGSDVIDLGDDNDWVDDTTGLANIRGGNGDDVVCWGYDNLGGSTSYIDGDAGADFLIKYGSANKWELDGGAPSGGSESDECNPDTGDGVNNAVFDCGSTNVATCPAPSN